MTARRGRRDRRGLWDKIWRDRGGRVVIYQHPNPWLIGWLVLAFISVLSPSNNTASVFWDISLIILAVWAIREVWSGVNYFRRLVGLLVLLLIIGSVFGLGL